MVSAGDKLGHTTHTYKMIVRLKLLPVYLLPDPTPNLYQEGNLSEG
ncbi:hypothetical protein [Pontibacter mangrovi]|nr:hypothetical protein [Pontibacter mangrovi]